MSVGCVGGDELVQRVARDRVGDRRTPVERIDATFGHDSVEAQLLESGVEQRIEAPPRPSRRERGARPFGRAAIVA